MNFSTQDITDGRQEALDAFKDDVYYAADILGQVDGFKAGFEAAIEFIRKEGAITVGEEDLWPEPPVSSGPNPDYIKEFKEVIDSYTWDGPEQDMLDMFAMDRDQMNAVLTHYEKGEWEQAKLKARHMDTAARECIPEGIWNDIQ